MAREIAVRSCFPVIGVVVAAVVCAAVLRSGFVDGALQVLLVESLALEHGLTSVLLLVPPDDLDVGSCLQVDRPRVRERVPPALVFEELHATAWSLAVLAIRIALARHLTLPCA